MSPIEPEDLVDCADVWMRRYLEDDEDADRGDSPAEVYVSEWPVGDERIDAHEAAGEGE